ncbi:Solute-binding periplasmic protein of iron/siderophore ABC transporter [Klebsiella pneumoniae]|uniref:Solute-binding periplasmic protein of iron/siderophore ABC transporter n=1 Tax=Klebsiella pneumoniae TaxID=573 RepID=A0A2X3EZB7_KLEPN|nr:Solute-binding periplasmic protein of iron/siderophore ABC transporter [Klebsiella pneumoniae]
MARKSVRSLLLTALLATPLLSYATQYPLTVTDLDGRQVTLAKEPQRIILQDGRDIMTLALLGPGQSVLNGWWHGIIWRKSRMLPPGRC